MSVEYKKELDVIRSSDVVVVGGGPSGVAAACAAAKLGKSTVLIEASGTLGGASALAMVAELMNFDDGENFLSSGFGREVFSRLALPDKRRREWHNVRYEELKRVYDALVLEAGVDVMLYTHMVDVLRDGGKVTHAVVSCPSGTVAVKGELFIDCTGSGALSVAAGAEYEHGDENGRTMSATLCSLWGGVDFEKKAGRDAVNYMKAYGDGVFSQYDTVLPGIKANYPEVGVGGGNVGHCFGVDDTSVDSMTKATFDSRRMLAEYERYYREYVDGCEGAVLIRSADVIGIRESRRIVCERMLTADSFFEQTPFEDEIGRYSYPVDIHPVTPDAEGMKGFDKAISMRHGKGESYSIPYACLVPKGVENLLVAGRCIGADRAMQASVRVIPCCYITGEAAGVAASVALDGKVSAALADVSRIREILRERGVFMK